LHDKLALYLYSNFAKRVQKKVPAVKGWSLVASNSKYIKFAASGMVFHSCWCRAARS